MKILSVLFDLLDFVGAISCFFGVLMFVVFVEKSRYGKPEQEKMWKDIVFLALALYLFYTGISKTTEAFAKADGIISRIIFSVFLLLSLYSFIRVFIKENGRNDDDQKRHKKELDICKRFGDCKITLFRFYGDKSKQDCTWVLIKDTRSYLQESVPYSHDYYVVDEWSAEENAFRKAEDAESEVRYLLHNLPYKMGIEDVIMSFNRYREIVHRNDGE